MTVLANLYVQLGVQGIGGVLGALNRVKAELTSFAATATAPIRRIGSTFLGLVNPMSLVGGALAAAGVAGTAGIMSLAAETEALATSFEVLLGSGQAAAKMIQDINKFAAETPFEQAELGKAAKQLLAFGTSAQDIIPTMRRLGDIAALAGVPLQDLVMIYGKIQSRGKMTGETLIQFQERGIPVTRELAKAFGVTEAQVADLVSQGKIGFADVQKAIEALTNAGGQYAGGMAKLALTTGGLWSTVTGNLKTALATFGQSLIDTFNIKDVLANLGTWLDSLAGRIKGFFDEWGPVMKQWLSSFVACLRMCWEMISSLVTGFLNLIGVTSALGKIDLKKAIMDGLMALEFFASNWRLYFQIMAERVRLWISNAAERFKTFFNNIVILVGWFADNFWDILKTVGNAIYTVFSNIVTNVKNLWSSVWDYIKSGGTKDFEFNYTPLLEGFESAVKQLPPFVEAAVKDSTPYLDQLTEELEKRRKEFYAKKREGEKPEEAAGEAPPPTAGPAGPAGPGLAGPATAVGKAGISFVGLADLAKQMQEEAGKRIQEQIAKASERNAAATEKLAQAAAGDRLRVEVVSEPTGRFAP
jgi:tape measure domain-containing protein